MTPEIDPKSSVLRIGQGQYNRETNTLKAADGTPIHLRKQSAAVLAALAANAGEVVSRDTLIEAVWKDIATTDDSLIQCIADIRRALGKDTITTFPKIGYRLAARPVAIRNRAVSPYKTMRMLVAVSLVGLLTGGLVLWFSPGPETISKDNAAIVPPQIVPDKTLAVLPFINLGGGENLQFFGDGLSEDLTTDLAKIPDLTVIAYASSFDFSAAEIGFQDIASDLGVRYLVRGTVRHAGTRVRINVALIDPYEGTNIWAERYDRVRQDPFDLQEDVTRAIVDALSLSLEAETAPSRVAPDAYFMLLRGLEPLRENTIAANSKAREYFKKAIDLEPDYARAHAYTAVAFGRDTMFDYSALPNKTSVQKGLEAAITAIQLEPELPNAYFALAILNLAIREHEKSLAAARHSIRLNRNFADGYAALAEAGVYGGDLDEALDAIQHAKRLHPHHPASYDWIEGHIYFQLNDAEAARPLLEQSVEVNPGFLPAFAMLAAAYVRLGEHDLAASVLSALDAYDTGFSIKKFLASTPYGLEARLMQVADALEEIGAD
ncbi:winged helix-turn-helix domain-containing tetratricopeptide repeat protein [Tateyamaria sp.]|uniref:winged helix-turn-helix domain-containing tetratricopeptide repeat protein n=1 Tax=Tateyamaria sp. TaxID=1929288 RepID=UPI00329E0448